MRKLGSLFLLTGLIFLVWFGFELYSQYKAEQQSLTEAQARIGKDSEMSPEGFSAKQGEAFATLEIPRLERTLPVVEGADPDSLDAGVGHLPETVFPGQGEQIVLSGHRDTVFRNFDQLEIGDPLIVQMPYGAYTYEIASTDIVPEDDTSVIRKMGEEVLVVSTCYPFHFIGNAPERFVIYAYPLEDEA
ncbi:class D sortase [Shouchella clausii]|uniref:class D sortase n=1 Tax=Shouchella clausii TaxID=79880 RepID=UPI0026FD3780|nr:class D sortase [Shouchella clausii]MDO7269240.1 class D sortase [Shouchella clausii]MDO7289122.1 class D sortase [Shouchella clausii]